THPCLPAFTRTVHPLNVETLANLYDFAHNAYLCFFARSDRIKIHMENLLEDWLGEVLKNEGFTGNSLIYIKTIILFSLVLVVAALFFFVAKKIIVRGVHA